MRSHRKQKRGAIVLLAAFSIVFVFAMLAFSVDLGYISKSRQELQTAADAAALAGGLNITSRSQLTGTVYNASAISSAAKTAATNCAALNMSAQAPVSLLSADVVCGYIAKPGDPTSPLTTATPYNAVQVVARHDATANGPLKLFFAPIWGVNSANLKATATAVYDTYIQGFKIGATGPQYASLLPFALSVNTWNAGLTSGPDDYRYNPTTRQVTSGSDGIREVQLYPYQNVASGNFGAVNLGNLSISNSQILYGPNAADLANMGGQIALGSSGTLSLAGHPGMSARIESALQSIIGQPRTIFLYSSVSGNGANATYTVVSFAGIVVVHAQLTGLHKAVIIQPEFVQDATAYGGGPAPSQFVYTALQLCR